MTAEELSINESIMLLALDEKNGRVRWTASPYLDYALAGGLLAELALRDLVQFDEKHRLVAAEEGRTESGLLNEVLRLVREEPTRRGVAEWVGSVLTLNDLAHRQMEELASKGILERKDDYFLLIFSTASYPALDHTAEKKLLRQIRDTLRDTGPVSPRLSVLITIANSAHLLRGLIGDEELNASNERIRQIARGSAIGKATSHLIRESERALYVASSIPFMGMPHV